MIINIYFSGSVVESWSSSGQLESSLLTSNSKSELYNYIMSMKEPDQKNWLKVKLNN